MSSISQMVKEIVLGDPTLFYCIANDIVNYSKLAKKLKPIISDYLGQEVSNEAIKMALIRLVEKIKVEGIPTRAEVLDIIARSSVEVRTGITIITLRSGRSIEAVMLLSKLAPKSRFLAVMQSVMALTVVLDNETAEEFIRSFGSSGDILQIQRDHSAIVIVSPQEIMYVPGVLSYIASILAQNNINIIHIESCYTDTIIIVSKDDLLKAFQVISRHIEAAKKSIERKKFPR